MGIDTDSPPTDEMIINWLKKIFSQDHVRDCTIFWAKVIDVLQCVKAIDETTIRSKHWVFEYATLMKWLSNKWEQAIEEQKYNIWDTVKIINSKYKKYSGIFSMLSYGDDVYYVIEWTIERKPQSLLSYTCRSLLADNVTVVPQCILWIARWGISPDSIKRWQIEWRIRKEILETRKTDTAKLSEIYSLRLRDFMESSKKLAIAMEADIDALVEKRVQMFLNTKKFIKQSHQVEDVEMLQTKIKVKTKVLYCEWKATGNYMIDIWTDSFGIKVENLCVNDLSNYQHPHVNSRWEVCFWDRLNPLKKAYETSDFVTIAFMMIEFLEHLNDDSRYIKLDEFCEDYKEKIDKTIKEEKKEEAKSEVIELDTWKIASDVQRIVPVETVRIREINELVKQYSRADNADAKSMIMNNAISLWFTPIEFFALVNEYDESLKPLPSYIF